MDNTDAINNQAKTSYRVIERTDGSLCFVSSPKGMISLPDAQDETELELTPDEWNDLRATARADRLTFAALKKQHGKPHTDTPTQPDKGKPLDTIKE